MELERTLNWNAITRPLDKTARLKIKNEQEYPIRKILVVMMDYIS